MERTGHRRDRRDRGMRGPGVLPEYPGTPQGRTVRERFDAMTLEIISEIDERWGHQLGLVEYAVEDTPVVPPDWQADRVPLSSLVRGSGARPSRLVLFRRPIEHRCATRTELRLTVRALVVEQVAELLGMDPEEIES